MDNVQGELGAYSQCTLTPTATYSSSNSGTVLFETKRGEKGRERMKIKCFKCWQIGVPPTWLVVCGALLVQVREA